MTCRNKNDIKLLHPIINTKGIVTAEVGVTAKG